MGEDIRHNCNNHRGRLYYLAFSRRRIQRPSLKMMFSSIQRKLTLVLHVTSSVGWIGSVAAFLVLAVIGLTSTNDLMIKACYVSMNMIAKLLIVPLSITSFATGIVMSLATPWGLFKHYWVLIKLIITILCVLILLLHMSPISKMAEAVSSSSIRETDMYDIRLQLIVNVIAGIIALLTATVLSIYKPTGLTKYGWKKMNRE
jgi:hypothetical protein